MSILSKKEILNRIEKWDIIFDPIDRLDKLIAQQSIDCTLYKEWYFWWDTLINLDINGLFKQWDFFLWVIDEWVGTRAGSWLCMEFKLKSTAARLGITHPIAWFCENWYFSRLCIELWFSKDIRLYNNMCIWQFIFHTIEWEQEDYTVKWSYQSYTTLDDLKNKRRISDVLPKSLKIIQ